MDSVNIVDLKVLNSKYSENPRALIIYEKRKINPHLNLELLPDGDLVDVNEVEGDIVLLSGLVLVVLLSPTASPDGVVDGQPLRHRVLRVLVAVEELLAVRVAEVVVLSAGLRQDLEGKGCW